MSFQGCKFSLVQQAMIT